MIMEIVAGQFIAIFHMGMRQDTALILKAVLIMGVSRVVIASIGVGMVIVL